MSSPVFCSWPWPFTCKKRKANKKWTFCKILLKNYWGWVRTHIMQGYILGELNRWAKALDWPVLHYIEINVGSSALVLLGMSQGISSMDHFLANGSCYFMDLNHCLVSPLSHLCLWSNTSSSSDSIIDGSILLGFEILGYMHFGSFINSSLSISHCISKC